MIALAPEDRADLLRWLVSGAIILCAHGAIAAYLFTAGSKQFIDASFDEPDCSRSRR